MGSGPADGEQVMRNQTESAVQPPRRIGRWERVRVVCAWCDQTIVRTDRERRRPVSHGLCVPCGKRLNARATESS